MVIPEIVIAVAFLGLTGAAGISKGFGVMVCAHTIFILPYIIVTLKSRFADYDVSIEEASLDLGANQIYTFIHIICPMILPGILLADLWHSRCHLTILSYQIFSATRDIPHFL